MPRPVLESAKSQKSFHLLRTYLKPRAAREEPSLIAREPSRGVDSEAFPFGRCDASRRVKTRFERSPVMGEMKEARLSYIGGRD